MFATIATILVLTIIVATTTTATNVRAEGAFQEGWHTGESDYKSVDDKNPRCSSDIEASTCASYRLGYEAGWISASALWPEDRQEATNNDNSNREDDGEFVPEKRTIDQTPKRVIGDSN